MQYEGSVVQWECTKGIDVCNLVLTLLDSSMNDKMIKFYITYYMLTSNSLCELSKTSWWSINYQSSTPFWVIKVINYLIKGLYILVLIIYCMYVNYGNCPSYFHCFWKRNTLTVLYLDLCCVFQDILWISKEYQMYACTAYTTDMKVQEKDSACAYFMKLFLHWAGFVKVILTGSVLVLNN